MPRIHLLYPSWQAKTSRGPTTTTSSSTTVPKQPSRDISLRGKNADQFVLTVDQIVDDDVAPLDFRIEHGIQTGHGEFTWKREFG